MNDADWRICAADRERLDRHVTLRRLIFFAALFLLFVFVCFVCFFFRFRGVGRGQSAKDWFVPGFFTEFFVCVFVCAGVAAVA